MRPVEGVRVDQDRLADLYAEMGESNAEDVVCRAMEDLALRMTQCEAFYKDALFSELHKTARGMIAVADQIGMTTLARVASDLTQTVAAADHAAVGATLARMIRIGERSLTAVWDLHDIKL